MRWYYIKTPQHSSDYICYGGEGKALPSALKLPLWNFIWIIWASWRSPTRNYGEADVPTKRNANKLIRCSPTLPHSPQIDITANQQFDTFSSGIFGENCFVGVAFIPRGFYSHEREMENDLHFKWIKCRIKNWNKIQEQDVQAWYIILFRNAFIFINTFKM